MGLNNQELSVVLKEVIDPEIIDQVERTPTLYKLIPKGGQSMNARGGVDASNKDGIFMYAKYEPNPSLGWFDEGGKYPAGAASRRVKFSAGYKRIAITSRLTRDVLEGADKSAIINVVTEEITDDTKSVLKEISQQLYGNGTGAKAIVVSAVLDGSDTVVTFKAPFGSTHLLNRGFYDFVSTGVDVTAELKSIPTKTTAVFAGDITGDIAEGQKVVFKGSFNKCISGLEYHVSDEGGDYQNIDRNDYPSFKAYVLDAEGEGISVAMLYKAIFQARYARRNNLLEGDYVMLSAPTQTHAYALLGDVSTAIQGNTGLNSMPNNGSLDYGFRSFKFAGLTWIEDTDCPPDVLYIINFSKFKIHEFKPLSKVFEGNGFLPVPSFTESDYSTGGGSYTDNVLYTMTWKGQLVSKDPQMAGVRIKNLATAGLALPTNDYSLEWLIEDDAPVVPDPEPEVED
jgi:hypothetical protein